eukprot:gnl/MRDRNA2_/MRDRNA2_100603_c0_seq1.p1 gnl/MRDRNA2_/MRDRNA2_100603_c0~~gnl/MRDRNA2_/MRDRNA2_100603_c0_seq1.p1  ORF type:complete len:194 (+),score=72.91 gnl/MRDRNA2_/MRDRNA2_100603_c0_seq1:98-679(+)
MTTSEGRHGAVKYVAPKPSGAALRDRLAGQLDAAFASKDENELKKLLHAGDQDEASELGASHLLVRPKAVAEPKDPLQVDELHRAAINGDLAKLGEHDARLKQLLESDDLSDPQAAAALKLYRDSFMAFAAGRDVEKDAFQAVMKDDVEALKALLDGGLPIDIKNPGGQTMMEVAKERTKAGVMALLAERKAA